MSERAVVMGQGYVGLPVAIRAVEAGYDVVGFELDETKVAALNAGSSHVEDITDERLAAALASGRYRASSDTADLADFDIAVISVPTPMREGAPDLRSAARRAGSDCRSRWWPTHSASWPTWWPRKAARARWRR